MNDTDGKVKEDSVETKPYLEFSNYSWWEIDKDGWPIELYKDKPFSNFVKIVFQNIRKITG